MNKSKFNNEIEEFCCECTLMEDVIDTLKYISNQKSGCYSSVAVICNEDLAEAILKHVCTLSTMDDLDLYIDYINFDKDDYEDLYGITLSMEDNEIHFGIETAMGNDRYKTFDMDYLYVSTDVDDEFIDCQPKRGCEIDVFELTGECEEEFDDDDFDECDGDCENCEFNGEESDEFESTEEIDLYDIVEDMISTILSEKYGL